MKWTIRNAAMEWGVSMETVTRGLRGNGLHDVGKRGRTYTTREIDSAIHGDIDAERLRETRARADLLEIDRRERERELMPRSEVEGYFAECWLPIRQHLMGLPQLASRVNPTDPEFARPQLKNWMDSVLQMSKLEVEKIAREKQQERKEN